MARMNGFLEEYGCGILILIAFIFFFGEWFIKAFWVPLLIIAIIVIIAVVILILQSIVEKKKNEIAMADMKQRNEIAMANMKQRRVAIKNALVQAKNDVSEFFISNISQKSLTLLDSNIWMADTFGYDIFFGEIIPNLSIKRTLVLLNSQLNEIEALKHNPDPKVQYRARIAIRRIDELQKKKLLYLPIEEVYKEIFHYADPNIIALVKILAKNDISLTLITDDLPLAIRLRAVIEHNNAIDRIFVYNSENMKIPQLNELNDLM